MGTFNALEVYWRENSSNLSPSPLQMLSSMKMFWKKLYIYVIRSKRVTSNFPFQSFNKTLWVRINSGGRMANQKTQRNWKHILLDVPAFFEVLRSFANKTATALNKSSVLSSFQAVPSWEGFFFWHFLLLSAMICPFCDWMTFKRVKQTNFPFLEWQWEK